VKDFNVVKTPSFKKPFKTLQFGRISSYIRHLLKVRNVAGSFKGVFNEE